MYYFASLTYLFVALKAMGLEVAFGISTLLLIAEFAVAVYALVKLFSKNKSEKTER